MTHVTDSTVLALVTKPKRWFLICGELIMLVKASREGVGSLAAVGWRKLILPPASAIRKAVLKLRHQKNHFQG
jgi:hypothetical protein